LERRIEGLRAADGGNHFIGGYMDVVLGGKLLHQTFAQRQDAGGRRVVRLVLYERLDCRIFNVRWRLKKRLASVKHMHLVAFGTQFHHLIANLYDIGKTYFIQPFRQSDSALLRNHGSVLSSQVGEELVFSISDARTAQRYSRVLGIASYSASSSV